jgi:hypothetical protein
MVEIVYGCNSIIEHSREQFVTHRIEQNPIPASREQCKVKAKLSLCLAN